MLIDKYGISHASISAEEEGYKGVKAADGKFIDFNCRDHDLHGTQSNMGIYAKKDK